MAFLPPITSDTFEGQTVHAQSNPLLQPGLDAVYPPKDNTPESPSLLGRLKQSLLELLTEEVPVSNSRQPVQSASYSPGTASAKLIVNRHDVVGLSQLQGTPEPLPNPSFLGLTDPNAALKERLASPQPPIDTQAKTPTQAIPVMHSQFNTVFMPPKLTFRVGNLR